MQVMLRSSWGPRGDPSPDLQQLAEVGLLVVVQQLLPLVLKADEEVSAWATTDVHEPALPSLAEVHRLLLIRGELCITCPVQAPDCVGLEGSQWQLLNVTAL